MRLLRVLVLLSVASLACHAATLRVMNLDQMADESSVVVQGKITASRTEWNPSHTSIITIYTVKADNYLKGSLGGTFELTELGGQIGNLMMNVEGVPRFQVGEEAVLFVSTDSTYHRNQAIGFEQGVYRVKTDPGTGLKYVNRRIPVGQPGEIMQSERAAARPEPSRELKSFLSQVSEAVSRVALERKTGVRQ